MADFDNKLNLNGVSEFKFVISAQKYPYLPNFSFVGPNWSYEAEIWYVGVFLGADYEFQLKISI